MIRTALLAASLSVLLAAPASGHGLRLTLTAEPGCLSGRIGYSDGWPGEGETATITTVDGSAAPRKVVADIDGRFSAPATPGRHRVRVVGDEDHEVEREVEVTSGVDTAPCTPSGPPPTPE
jgi:hypothetical protein